MSRNPCPERATESGEWRPTEAARTVATDCGRWLTQATWRSCSAGARTTRRAPTASTADARSPGTSRPSGGQSSQSADSNSVPSRAPNPLFSLPVIGWPPTKRGRPSPAKSPAASAQISPLVLPTSVTAPPSGMRAGLAAIARRSSAIRSMGVARTIRSLSAFQESTSA